MSDPIKPLKPRPEASARGFLRWRRDERGVTALEFAMLAPVFFLLVTAMIEVALIIFSNSTLRNGTHQAARMVRVGAAQCLTNADFVHEICSAKAFLPSCKNRIEIKRDSYPVGFGGEGESVSEIADLNPGEIVKIDAIYNWSVISPIVSAAMGEDSGYVSVRQSFLFKIEDYLTESCEGEVE